MHYIQQLRRAVAIREAQLRTMDAQIHQFRAFLHSPKFTGTENGERKDWISTGDVLNWLREAREASIRAGDDDREAEFNNITEAS